jgi:hypothetical protein
MYCVLVMLVYSIRIVLRNAVVKSSFCFFVRFNSKLHVVIMLIRAGTQLTS